MYPLCQFFSVFLVLSDRQLITRIVSNYWRWLILIFFAFVHAPKWRLCVPAHDFSCCYRRLSFCSFFFLHIYLYSSSLPPFLSLSYLLFPLTSHSGYYQKLWGVGLLVTTSLKMNKRKTFTMLYSHVTQCYPDHSKESMVTSWRVKRCDLQRPGWVSGRVILGLSSKWVS